MYVFVSTHNSTVNVARMVVVYINWMGHRTFIYYRDIHPGEIFFTRMAEELDAADWVVCLASDDFFTSVPCQLELATALVLGKLIMMKVDDECKIPTMYTTMVYIDMTRGKKEEAMNLLELTLQNFPTPGGGIVRKVEVPKGENALRSLLARLENHIANFRGPRSERAELYFERANIYRHLGMHEEALSDVNMAISLGILENASPPLAEGSST